KKGCLHRLKFFIAVLSKAITAPGLGQTGWERCRLNRWFCEGLGELACQHGPGFFVRRRELGHAVEERQFDGVALEAASHRVVMRRLDETPGHFEGLLVLPGAAGRHL